MSSDPTLATDLPENEAPEITCNETEIPTSVPVIRFPGGQTLEPQIDPTSGTPSSCGLTLDVVGQLNSALAPFQPFLIVLDMVAKLAQCFLLVTEVVTNPFKIPDLLACIPTLIDKINRVLALIPIFPQGIAAFVTFFVDILRFAATQIDCVISVLQSIQDQLDELDRLRDRAVNTDDPFIVNSLEELIACSEEETARQTSLALAVLGPIARILCVVRSLIALIPGGQEIARALSFPDPSNITSISSAITLLETVRDALLAAVDAAALLSPLGVQLAPELVFTCPLDDLPPEDEEEEEIPIPEIDSLLDGAGAPLPGPGANEVAQAPAAARIQILGTNFTASSQVFWGTSPIADDDVVAREPGKIIVDVSTDVRQNLGVFLLMVVNTGADLSEPFIGIGESVGTPPENNPVEVSEPFEVEVV
jgi:hypothetical protein